MYGQVSWRVEGFDSRQPLPRQHMKFNDDSTVGNVDDYRADADFGVEEQRAALSDEELRVVDSGIDGQICKKEFTKFSKSQATGISKSGRRVLWDSADEDGSGMLGTDGLQYVLGDNVCCWA